MTSETLELERLKCKTLLEENILQAKRLLLENLQNVNLSGLIIKLNKCIQNLNRNSHDLEEIHEKLSLIATKENEDEILEQIEIDFDCIISAIDIRIELEVIEKEAKFKIKDLETSAKLPLTKKLDTLISKAESQMAIIRRNQTKIMKYFDIDSQQKDELIDVEKIASNKECSSGGEDADVSIMRTNEIAKRTTLEASNSCQPNVYMSSCKRQMGHQEQTVLQGQIALKETLVSVTVASKGALKIQKPNGQKQKNRKKNKVKFSARSKRTLNSRNWRKSQFHRKLIHKKRKPGFQKGKVLQRKKAAKRRHTHYTHKGQNAYGVRNSVPICYRLWWKERRKRLFIKVARVCHRRKAICCDQKMGSNKEKKRRKKSAAEKRRRKCWRRKMKGCEKHPRWITRKKQSEEKYISRVKVRIISS